MPRMNRDKRRYGGERESGEKKPEKVSGKKYRDASETEPLTGNMLEGRNVVLEAIRAGKEIEQILLQEGLKDGTMQLILKEARERQLPFRFAPKERLDALSHTGHHQGVIAKASAFTYAGVEDILARAREKGEAPFLILLDGIEDPHNLGAILRSANLAGAHGVIIPKNRAVGLTETVARTSAGAIHYTPVAKVTNLTATIRELKEQGLWFVCAAMDGESMYKRDLTGPIGLVIGSEGDGVSRLVREACDFTVSIPMKGDIDSLNASVAAGILAFEIAHQRNGK